MLDETDLEPTLAAFIESHLGLVGMRERERVRLLSGAMNVSAMAPGAERPGTRAELTLPRRLAARAVIVTSPRRPSPSHRRARA